MEGLFTARQPLAVDRFVVLPRTLWTLLDLATFIVGLQVIHALRDQTTRASERSLVATSFIPVLLILIVGGVGLLIYRLRSRPRVILRVGSLRARGIRA